MKGPSLQKTAALSAVLHVTFFFLTALVFKQTSQMTISSPYVVSLVGPPNGQPERSRNNAAPSPEREAVAVPAEKNTTEMTTMRKEEKIDQKRIKERVAEIESEISAKKKIERLADLKRKMISIGGRNEKSAVKSSSSKGSFGSARPSQGAPGATSYEDKIRSEIYRQWFYPETAEKNLETIVSVKIRKDGSIPMQNIVIEKKSGNRMFDRQAVEAVANASPVSPPPYDGLEIGIRFYP